MKTLVAVLALSACNFPERSQELACEVTADCEVGRVCLEGFCVVPDDDGPDAGAAVDGNAFDCTTFDGRHFRGCDLPAPSEALALSLTGTYLYNTDTGSITPPSGSVAAPASIAIGGNRVISVESLSIGANAKLRVVGTLPLVVASWSTISVATGATIDVSSTATEAGAGANPPGCTQRAAAPGTSNGDGGAGGGGGGFGAAGGNGGNSGNSPVRIGGAGGIAIGQAPLLAGGCAGANGGNGRTLGGIGGNGGGAIQLTAKDSITIAGIIHAGGAGGAGGSGGDADSAAGGGGGGSGGMIGLESTAITIQSGAILAANGGGGGGGSENALAGPGGDATANANAATRGARQGDGGNGGAGSTTAAGVVGQSSALEGGGGGGGGAGVIVFATVNGAAPPTTGVVVSPAASAIQR